MFIKKDTRKVREILRDSEDLRTHLKLARREAEFNGSTHVLCDEIDEDSISNVQYLSLYGNKLQKLPGIGCFAVSPLQTLNLGRNLLPSLPMEMQGFSQLEVLWADDNQFTEVPECIFHLTNLRTLRLSGNKISSLPSQIEELAQLQELALDGNQLQSLPAELASLTQLKKLLVQSNKIEEIPETLGSLNNLEYLAVNSNELTSLPDSLATCHALHTLIANSNRITEVPPMLTSMPALRVVNLSHNQIAAVPQETAQALGSALPEGIRPPGDAAQGSSCAVQQLDLTGNPLLSAFDKVTLAPGEYHEPIIRDIQAKKARR